MHVLYLHLAWPNYRLDVLNITMHTEVVIHSMKAYVCCWSKICGSLDEIPSVTMGSCKSKLICIKRQTQRVQQDFIGQGHYGKVKSRSHHDVAHLHPPTNVPTKYQLPTPCGF